MTFALNITTDGTIDGEGNVWDRFSPLSKLIATASVNNKAQFAGNADAAAHEDMRKVLGDATDAGLLRFCDKFMDVDDVREAFFSVFSIPFNSKNKWALNMVRIPGDNDHYVVMIKARAPPHHVHCWVSSGAGTL
jgi:Cation transport ATPase (P-type)